MKKADIPDMPPLNMARFLAAIDLNRDGKINLPELDLAIGAIQMEHIVQQNIMMMHNHLLSLKMEIFQNHLNYLLIWLAGQSMVHLTLLY